MVMLLAISICIVIIWLIDVIIKPINHIPKHMHISTASCAFSPSAQQTAFSQLAWSSCALPDNWNTTHPDQQGDAWYRMQIPAAHSQENMAVYLASFSMNAEVWWNGMRLGSGGSFAEPVARNWNTPLFFSIANASIDNHKANKLLIHVKGYTNNGSGLGNIFYGEEKLLHPIFWQHTLSSRGMSIAVFSLALLIGLIFLCLYISLQQKSYLYLSLASLISCFYVADIFMLYIPVSQSTWEIIAHSSLLLSQYLLLLFILDTLKLKGRSIPWLKHLSLAHVGLSIALLLVCSEINLIPFASLGHSIGLLWLFYLCLILWHYWLKTGVFIVAMLASAVFFEGIVFVYDWVPWVVGRGPTPPYLFPLGPLAFSLVASVMLMLRFIAGSKQEHNFRLELKASLQRQKCKLHDKHESLLKLEQQHAIHQEQERITRELHDGVATHLIGAKGLIDSDRQQAKQLIDESMDELRTLMDSLDSNGDLLSKLGMMRHRLEGRLNAQGIYFDWQVWNIPQYMPQNPQTIHHIIRIVQESLHNIEKHAKASNIKVFIDLSGIVIQDNGCGFDLHNHTSGRGLKNITWRAEQANAILNITTSHEGTSINMYWNKGKS